MNQKLVLSTTLGVVLLIAGCLSGGIPGDTSSPTETIAPVTTHSTPTNVSACSNHGLYKVDTEPVEELGPHTIEYRNQSSAARSILKTAIGPGMYVSCERTGGFEDLLERWFQLQQNTEEYIDVLWLQYRGENYCLTMWQQDQLRSACHRIDS